MELIVGAPSLLYFHSMEFLQELKNAYKKSGHEPIRQLMENMMADMQEDLDMQNRGVKRQVESTVNHLNIKDFGQSGINAGDELYQIVTVEHKLQLESISNKPGHFQILDSASIEKATVISWLEKQGMYNAWWISAVTGRNIDNKNLVVSLIPCT